MTIKTGRYRLRSTRQNQIRSTNGEDYSTKSIRPIPPNNSRPNQSIFKTNLLNPQILSLVQGDIKLKILRS